jgi:hypothetical protein
MSSEKGRRKYATSLACHVPVYIFGDRMTKLSDYTLNAIGFKWFCEILIVHIENGIDPSKIEWGAVVNTVTMHLEYGNPRKVQFHDLPLDASLELKGWTDASIMGSTRGGRGQIHDTKLYLGTNPR